MPADEATPAETRLYVYYRIRADIDPVYAERQIKAMQIALCRDHAAHAQLLHRRDDPLTWMETYECMRCPDSFEAQLNIAVAQCGLDQLLDSGAKRHVERFVGFSKGA